VKVLITGGYGFIGSHVAERFNKEGYEVFIIDNLVSGSIHNVTFKHKGYRLDIEDRKCEEIFRSNRFDAVVHLAAQANVAQSIDNPRLDTESNILGLVNMLALSQKYKAKKFIFASSAAVYGLNDDPPIQEDAPCAPISPYGMSKWTGERYCSHWTERYGLETIVFRFSNVYGPRQGNGGEGGVISIFLKQMLAGKELSVYGDGEQTRDFIYVEDIADAIYRASYSTLTGIYNLSTAKESSVNSILEHMKTVRDIKAVVYKDEKEGDIRRSVLDNSRIVRGLDWTPMYGLSEGLNKTYQWFLNEHPLKAAPVKPEKRESGQAFRRLKPYSENLLAFAVTIWLTLSSINESYLFLDFKIFYITIIGIIYGNRQSIIASALSIVLLLYQKLADGREFISLLYDTDFFFQSAMYLFIGLVVGYAMDRKTGVIDSQSREIEELSDKYEFLQSVYTEVRDEKDVLLQRIQNNGDSFGKIYTVTKELDSLEPDHIYNSTVTVVESIMGAKSVAIYTVNPYRSYLRLVAQSIGETKLLKSIKVEDSSYVKQMFEDGNLYINKDLVAGIPLMSAPIQLHGETVAVISIDGIPFENFSLYYQNLFRVTVDLVSSALSRAFSYIEASESKRYVEGSSILNKEVFASILENKRHAKEKHNISYLLAACDGGDQTILEVSRRVSGVLRETDYLGIGEDNSLWVLLSNTGQENATNVIRRFAEQNITLKLLEEELSYG